MLKKVLIVVLLMLVVIGGWYYFSQRERPESELERTLPEEEARSLTSHNPDDPGEECPEAMTPMLTEGPYYKVESPEDVDLVDEGVAGEVLTITGHVFDQDCELVPNAWLDFWQADGGGTYDNAGFTLRGHQFTDGTGHFTLMTVVPGEYPGRTPHIHVKVRASDESEVVTTQLFFPGEVQNQNDSIFDQDLVLFISAAPKGKTANFNFKVPRE